MSAVPSVELLGREPECACVAAAIAADRPVLVSGEAGIGKTTLVRAAATMASRRLVEGSGFATLAAMPYLALRRVLGADPGGEPGAMAVRVEAVIGPDVLFIDDLQWVDRDTRDVVALLAGRIGLVVAARDVTAVDERLTGPPWEHVALVPLDRPAAEAVARRVRPGATPGELGRVLARAGGNPLLIEELAREGRESPTVRRAIAERLRGLSAPARYAVRLLALAERPLPVAPFAAATDELARAGLVERAEGEIRIRHALLGEAILDDVPPGEIAGLRRSVASLVDDPADAARQLLLAGDRDRASEVAHEALATATDLRARATLLRIAAEAAPPGHAAGLRVEAARAAWDLEDAGTVRDLLLPVDDGPDALLGVRDGLLARALVELGQAEQAQAVLDHGRTLELDPAGEGAYEIATETALLEANVHGDLVRAIAVLDPIASQSGAGTGAGGAWLARRRALLALLRYLNGEPADVAAIEGGYTAAMAAARPAVARAAIRNLHSILLITRGPAEALALVEDQVPRLEAAGMAAAAAFLRSESIQTLTFLGRAAEAVLVADRLLEEPQFGREGAWAAIKRAEALTILGRYDEARATLDEVQPVLLSDYQGVGEWRIASAHLELWAGRPARAAELANSALSVPSHYAGNYLLPAVCRAWADFELGRDPRPAPETPWSWVRDGAQAEIAGVTALARTEHGRAVDALDQAAASWHGRHLPRELVCAWGAAEAARRARHPAAVDRLLAVVERADAIAFVPLAARARRSLRLAGRRPPPPPGPAVAPAGLLTAREQQILDLVAAGLSNIEIARRMGLGRPTVARVLSRAMAKLGADSRTEAVARMAIR